jgi:hypothetical protein
MYENQDIGTTYVWDEESDEPSRVAVNPWELLKNLIENAGLPNNIEEYALKTLDALCDLVGDEATKQ